MEQLDDAGGGLRVELKQFGPLGCHGELEAATHDGGHSGHDDVDVGERGKRDPNIDQGLVVGLLEYEGQSRHDLVEARRCYTECAGVLARNLDSSIKGVFLYLLSRQCAPEGGKLAIVGAPSLSICPGEVIAVGAMF